MCYIISTSENVIARTTSEHSGKQTQQQDRETLRTVSKQKKSMGETKTVVAIPISRFTLHNHIKGNTLHKFYRLYQICILKLHHKHFCIVWR